MQSADLNRPTALFHNMLRDLLDEGSFLNPDIQYFVLDMTLKGFTDKAFSEEEKHRIVYLFNLFCIPRSRYDERHQQYEQQHRQKLKQHYQQQFRDRSNLGMAGLPSAFVRAPNRD